MKSNGVFNYKQNLPIQRSGGSPMTIAYCKGIVITTKNIKIIQTFAKVPLESITKVINHKAYKTAYKSILVPTKIATAIKVI